MLIGYARVSADEQDTTAQTNALRALGVDTDRIYVDQGLTGRNRNRPDLTAALSACRQGDTFIVTKLDRLARSMPDARDIADELARGGVRLSIGGEIYDPTSPTGRLFFNVLATMAEFESDLIRARTKEGMAVAKAKGRLKGRAPKLTARREAHALALIDSGDHTMGEVASLFGVSRGTLYRARDRRVTRGDRTSVVALPRVEGE
ncbi:recombinase family protein [Okibacterium fritillariae]|uniref:recombinase family protein n=1 Tax=Okibacterium fritillariae TaxID=123320 RepID=UPI0040556FB4